MVLRLFFFFEDTNIEKEIMQPNESPYVFVARIPMPSIAAAHMAAQVLKVDQPVAGSTKSVFEESHTLVIQLQSQSLRTLRTATHSVLEQLTLVTRTMEAFVCVPR